ncbi:MAG: hypothetical protein BAJALOKI1v1_1440007 [Promethearchaeota archaeon]|nr:MAG: hypothetical protein BAJALOKI1v1_1440007 [Candidatus Lokiarchaeota archaeon]
MVNLLKKFQEVTDYKQLFKVNKYKNTKLFRIYPGKLKIPTGKIVAGDPFLIFHCNHFEKTISPGEYEVELIFLELPTAGNRLAIARIVVSEKDAQYWELALLKNEDIGELAKGEFIGFVVDSGLACFIDHQFCKEFTTTMDGLYRKNSNFNYYDDVLAAEFAENAFNKNDPRDVGDWTNHKFDSNSIGNVMIFSSGFGDGLYPVYWGIDNEGKITDLLIDFFVISF